jgi:SAM-dependent methyltransferase
LDFGCGNGEFVEEAGPRAFGLELSTKPNKKRIYCELMEIPVSSYDFVTLWGVLEHLNDPLTTLRSLCAKLRPQGYLVMTTVDAEGHIPYYYKPPEHLTYWTRGALNVLAEDIGIEICQVFSYEMLQLSSVYLDRLLSRTPVQYRNLIISQARNLPRVITVPTNELMVVARRAINRC